VNLDSIVQQLQQQQASSGTTAKAVTAKTSTASGSGAGDTGDATITANDFLTLLVTELQHQDPTSDTDPNAYVNQLVEVNSLQQLISINTGIGTLDSSVTSTTTSTSTSGATGSAVASLNGASASTSVTPGQVANARASYAAFEPAPLSVPDPMIAQLSVSAQLDPSNPLMNSPDSSVNPAVPAMWQSTQGVTS
jgi:flagellar basal-body rod modification protein FlgD